MLWLASARTVLVRCSAEMPVVSPCLHVDRHREGGAERRVVGRHHRIEPQPARLVGRQGRADDAAGVADDEGHLLGRAERGRDDRSPSFSRSSSSMTTTISPRANASMASVTLSDMQRSNPSPFSGGGRDPGDAREIPVPMRCGSAAPLVNSAPLPPRHAASHLPPQRGEGYSENGHVTPSPTCPLWRR